MKQQINNVPNYRKIFRDIIDMKYPNKEKECKNILKKEVLTTFDILVLNEKIFGATYTKINQMHKSYTKRDIIKILDYQKKNCLNNTQTANQFQLSRNTLARWKKSFLI